MAFRGRANDEKERRRSSKETLSVITRGRGGHLEDADAAAYRLITGLLHILTQGSFYHTSGLLRE